MSLDVYLYTELTRPAEPSERIYVRRDGAQVEITREEWDTLHPDREPLTVLADVGNEVYTANITHNMGRMARECGLYEPLWRPEEIGAKLAHQLIVPLREGLRRLRNERERLQEFNPKNGWGNYDLLVRFTEDYYDACGRWPEAEIEVSR